VRRIARIALCSVVVALPACGGSEKPARVPSSAENSITVELQEYSFAVAGQARAGRLTLNFQNRGNELHMGVVGRLDRGKTVQDLLTELRTAPSGAAPAWFHDDPADGSILSPGQGAGVTIDARQPGTYALLCFVTAPTGKPHAFLGMAQSFTVAGAAAPKGPSISGRFVLGADALQVPTGLKEGSVTMAITNNGTQPGNFDIVRFANGKTREDVNRWFGSGFKGPAPATFLGGIRGAAPGSTTPLRVALQRGTYTAVASFEGGNRSLTREFVVS
jgi:hypothetical protein